MATMEVDEVISWTIPSRRRLESRLGERGCGELWSTRGRFCRFLGSRAASAKVGFGVMRWVGAYLERRIAREREFLGVRVA